MRGVGGEVRLEEGRVRVDPDITTHAFALKLSGEGFAGSGASRDFYLRKEPLMHRHTHDFAISHFWGLATI